MCATQVMRRDAVYMSSLSWMGFEELGAKVFTVLKKTFRVLLYGLGRVVSPVLFREDADVTSPAVLVESVRSSSFLLTREICSHRLYFFKLFF